jgi:hypothetical protein
MGGGMNYAAIFKAEANAFRNAGLVIILIDPCE